MIGCMSVFSTAYSMGSAAPAQARCGVVSMGVAKPSKAMPFLTAPACQSVDMVGNAGFDPLYFSDFLDIKWLREAELKHGRICMLASVGMVAPEFFTLPNYPGATPNPVEAFSSVPSEGIAQIFLFMAWLELYYFNKGKWTMMTMFEDKDRVPGNVGFDPLQFGKNTATRERLELQELTHGRLAMLAFSGEIHQVFVTGKPVIASLQDIFATP
jgi:hypothetical protein|mmetsp:Transcript_12941/g.29420  ORF Transcript_12941/g.29420 Transcript_12941/m.29420 type:complete len:213 (-) Transcript_12941:243-881(-)